MPFFDTIMGALGSPDPLQEAKDYSARQAAANAAALGNAPPGGAPSGQPDPATTLPPGQTPQATKTPQDMGSIIVDLTRREQAKQGWNQALGMGFAAVSQPRDREMVSKMFNVQPIDAAKLGESIMGVNAAQQGQDRSNQLISIANLPTNDPNNALGKMATAMNMDPQSLAFMIKQDPAKAAQLIAAGATPTPDMANLQQINRYMAGIAPKYSGQPQVLDMIKNAMLAKMAGPDAEAAVSDAMAYKARTGKDAPWIVNGQIDQGGYKQFQADQAQRQQERGKASQVLADNQNTAEELRSNLEQVRDSPGLQSIMTDSVKKAAAQYLLQHPEVDVKTYIANNTLTADEAGVVATLRKIGGASTETAMRTMAGTGTRVTQQEVGPLKDAIGSTQNLNQDFASYVHNAINPLITKTKKTVANAYGASGNLTHMDPEYEPWLHPIYRKGGELQGTGSDQIPDLQTLPQNKIDWAKRTLAAHPEAKEDIFDSLQQDGFDVSPLRKKDPSKW